jgi:hypothetical protein
MRHFMCKLKSAPLGTFIIVLGRFWIAGAIITFVAATSWADSTARQHSPVNRDNGAQPLQAARITIEKKSLQNIYTVGQRYAVDSETLFVGTDGKELTIRTLWVPCDAEVQYRIENGVRTAKRVNIRRVAPDARWQWVSDHPE